MLMAHVQDLYGGGQEYVSIVYVIFVVWGGVIDVFFSTTKYSPFMIHLQNRLISNSHCSTYYDKLLFVCGGEGYCELLVGIG